MPGPMDGVRVVEIGVWVAGPAAGGFVDVPDGDATTLLPATPVDFTDTPWAPRWMAPDAGQHTDQVLGELGRDASDIAGLRDRGVVA